VPFTAQTLGTCQFLSIFIIHSWGTAGSPAQSAEDVSYSLPGMVQNRQQGMWQREGYTAHGFGRGPAILQAALWELWGLTREVGRSFP
jgi:hypothetical protein